MINPLSFNFSSPDPPSFLPPTVVPSPLPPTHRSSSVRRPPYIGKLITRPKRARRVCVVKRKCSVGNLTRPQEMTPILDWRPPTRARHDPQDQVRFGGPLMGGGRPKTHDRPSPHSSMPSTSPKCRKIRTSHIENQLRRRKRNSTRKQGSTRV